MRFFCAEENLCNFFDSLGSSDIILVPAASAVASQWSLETHGKPGGSTKGIGRVDSF